MSIVVFTTIITGVCVFVTGHILVKGILDPYLSFKEQLGMVSAILLREQNKIINLSASNEVIDEIKHASALLLSKSNAVPLYGAFVKLRLLPQHKSIIKASRNLNLIASTLEGASNITPRKDYVLVNDSLNAIGRDLRIIVTYKGL
ncbi:MULTISPECIES: hypothetical protein [Enterobacter]|uniref:hypothetical protein n=1 Tax=Enterobacter TaxID=547 RepID=UPI00066996B2|nr:MULTISPECIES: hypothetical protein [Enterobacter]MCI9496913.1 hypothetical protein [Enterobacter hormaechei subsp. steigerwaltii]QLO47383.1 hypothetical protein HV216_10035 [Enterobacter cloacae]DAI82895.1 MAG TPA: hypothetical protein [Caudoviricetes sp.]HDT5074137.1 hypothetical protein [Enterobacter asburiae]AOP91185.1 hypothetical protein BFV63_09835 [Enterobacter hormaechei subsp. xiangfangensis]